MSNKEKQLSRLNKCNPAITYLYVVSLSEVGTRHIPSSQLRRTQPIQWQAKGPNDGTKFDCRRVQRGTGIALTSCSTRVTLGVWRLWRQADYSSMSTATVSGRRPKNIAVVRIFDFRWHTCEYAVVVSYMCQKVMTKHCASEQQKKKAFPLQAWTGPWGSTRLRLQNF